CATTTSATSRPSARRTGRCAIDCSPNGSWSRRSAMSSKHLSTKSLLELLDLFERSRQPLADVDGQVLRGVPGWDLSRITSMPPKARDAWLERVGYAGSFPAPCRDEHVPVELEEDDDPARYRYRCPDPVSRFTFLSSRALLAANFSAQNSCRVAGAVEYLQPCTCQKQPCTTTTALNRGNTRSGDPDSFLSCRRYRSASLCNALRRRIAGPVSRCCTDALTRERPDSLT